MHLPSKVYALLGHASAQWPLIWKIKGHCVVFQRVLRLDELCNKPMSIGQMSTRLQTWPHGVTQCHGRKMNHRNLQDWWTQTCSLWTNKAGNCLGPLVVGPKGPTNSTPQQWLIVTAVTASPSQDNFNDNKLETPLKGSAREGLPNESIAIDRPITKVVRVDRVTFQCHPYGIYHLIEENDLPDYDKKIQDFALVESIATFMC